jgi:TonB-linked SusC/RagA family outer membrane protein
MKKLLSLSLLLWLTVLYCPEVSAQEKKWVSGILRDPGGNPVASATITEKGTNNQALSDGEGAFRLQTAAGATLVISSVGFITLEVPVSGSSSLSLTIQSAASSLNEVVVTALGVKRQKKSLGYAVQEVKGTTLLDAREPNLTNALTGVVAGLQVVRSSTGPAGSSKITLRGNNSLTGKNQPLIVVDGVPVDNFIGAFIGPTNNDYFNPSLDMGNGMADINAGDIETISVLKGPSAAALYGSRAGNGVILITTKTGRKQNGLGIQVSSTVGVESIFTHPDRQTSFAMGSNDAFNPTAGGSWGPRITGQTVTNWKGQQEQLAAYENVKNFYETGLTQNHNVSFQQQFNNTSIYTSLNYLNDKSMIPGTKLTRTNLTVRAVSKFGKGDKWTTDTKIQYSSANAQNRPLAGLNSSNYAAMLYNLPISLDIRQFDPPVNQFGSMIWYDGSNRVNPYWATRYNLNQDVRDRFIMTGSLKYNFTTWLNAEVKGGADMYTTNYDGRLFSGSPLGTTGRFNVGKQTFAEYNYSTLITAQKDNLFGKLGATASVGGNLMQQKASRVGIDAGELKVPNLFSAINGKAAPTLTDDYRERKINSLYGTAGINWDGYLFLDATFRNDWSSTLHPDNRSFFYPSVSLAYLFTESFKQLPSWISYGKVRASYATVGNDLEPYQLYNTYTIGNDPNQNTIAARKPTLYDKGVRSELIKSTELGAELRFLNSRIGLDFSYYKSNATRQLIDLPMDPASGYTSRKINAGDIQNSGFEVMLDARVLNNPGGFNWNISANFSRNRNVVNEISDKDSVSKYQLGGFDAVSVQAVKGELYGEIYGSTFLRVTDDKSPYFGQLILNGSGLPQTGMQNQRLGNQQATGLLGVTNTFGYKGFTLGVLIDARFGGQIFSATQVGLQRAGVAEITAPGGERPDMVVAGVVVDGAGYKPNATSVKSQQYWEQVTNLGNAGITELNLYDASNVRIRNIQLNYDLPLKILSKTPIQRAKIGVSCNNVWLISSHMRGLDPESVFATSTNAVGFENVSPPTTRTILFNLSLTF